jgi:putative membrane protein
MTIEGVRNFQEVRDFLYSRMRGAAAEGAAADGAHSGEGSELADLLRATAAELRGIREALEARRQSTD